MLSSSGVVKLVSVMVSVGTSFLPKPLLHTQLAMEARIGIEPMMQLLQSRAFPLGSPATGTGRLILFGFGIKLSFAVDSHPDRRRPCQRSVLAPKMRCAHSATLAWVVSMSRKFSSGGS